MRAFPHKFQEKGSSVRKLRKLHRRNWDSLHKAQPHLAQSLHKACTRPSHILHRYPPVTATTHLWSATHSHGQNACRCTSSLITSKMYMWWKARTKAPVYQIGNKGKPSRNVAAKQVSKAMQKSPELSNVTQPNGDWHPLHGMRK